MKAELSEGGDHAGLRGAISAITAQVALAKSAALRFSTSEKVAERGGETSNTSVFKILSDWEAQLQAQGIDFDELSQGPDASCEEGPSL
ncbi:MAG: hypothetical protein AAFY84_06130 [Pseudomonadota bacterium]